MPLFENNPAYTPFVDPRKNAPPPVPPELANMTPQQIQQLQQQMQQGQPLQMGPLNNVFPNANMRGPLSVDPSLWGSGGGDYGGADTPASLPPAPSTPAPQTPTPGAPNTQGPSTAFMNPSPASLQRGVAQNYPSYAPPTNPAANTGFVPPADVGGYYNYNADAPTPFQPAPGAANTLAGIVGRGGALTPNEKAMAQQLGVKMAPGSQPGGAGGPPMDASFQAFLKQYSPMGAQGIINPDAAPLAAAASQSALQKQGLQQQGSLGFGELGLKGQQLALEGRKLDMTKDPAALTSMIVMDRLKQGLPTSDIDIKNIYRSMDDSRNQAGGPPSPNPTPGGPPPKKGGNANLDALSKATPTPAEQMEGLGGLDVLTLQQNLANAGKDSNTFPNFLEGTIKTKGEQWLKDNFPAFLNYSNSVYPQGVANYVNPSGIGQFIQGLGSTLTGPMGGSYQPAIPVGERVRGFFGAHTLEDIRRAQLRNELSNLNLFKPGRAGPLSPGPYQP